jgi:hypothetical protein
MENVLGMMYGKETGSKGGKIADAILDKGVENVNEYGLGKGIIETGKDIYNAYKSTKKK